MPVLTGMESLLPLLGPVTPQASKRGAIQPGAQLRAGCHPERARRKLGVFGHGGPHVGVAGQRSPIPMPSLMSGRYNYAWLEFLGSCGLRCRGHMKLFSKQSVVITVCH